jgi:glutamyl-tRNA synthetase
MNVRVRFAPSPTGYFHVGGARTALYNWLLARHYGGAFILRIEDTDQVRYQPEALDDLLTSLRWLGLDWDEGPEIGGDYGPYFQSERLALYHKYTGQLLEDGHVYYCYCSPERLAQMRQAQRAPGAPAGYDRHCRELTARQRAEYEAQGIAPVVRFKTPLEGVTSYEDVIRGPSSVDNRTLDDLVLLKSDGFPTYHLANVVDDHLMRITHILRGDEWLPSVPRHVLLYQALGWELPVLAHLPIILSPTGKGKMSKRKTVGPGGQEYDVLVRDFRRKGYLPEAMINFLALVGWGYDDKTELFDRQELIRHFTLEGVNKSAAAFSYDKLDWLNGVYIRALTADDLAARLTPVLREAGLDADPDAVRGLAPLVQERLKRLTDVLEVADFVFTDELSYDPADLTGKKMTLPDSMAALEKAIATLEVQPDFEEETLEKALRDLVEQLGLKTGQLFGIVRLAVTGKQVSPPLFGTLHVLGRERSLARMRRALRAGKTLLAGSSNGR